MNIKLTNEYRIRAIIALIDFNKSFYYLFSQKQNFDKLTLFRPLVNMGKLGIFDEIFNRRIFIAVFRSELKIIGHHIRKFRVVT